MISAFLGHTAAAEYRKMDRDFMRAANQIRATRKNAALATLNATTGLIHATISGTSASLKLAWNHPRKTALATVAALGVSYQDDIKNKAMQTPHLIMANLCEAAPTCSDDEALNYRINAAVLEATNG